MCEGESGSKYVGLLTIKDKSFKMEPLELKSIRQMHFETIKLSECENELANSEQVQSFIEEKIELILASLRNKHSGKHLFTVL